MHLFDILISRIDRLMALVFLAIFPKPMNVAYVNTSFGSMFLGVNHFVVFVTSMSGAGGNPSSATAASLPRGGIVLPVFWRRIVSEQ